MTTRLYAITLGVALLIGIGLGYYLHGSPAPTPTVRAAVQTSRAATEHAAKAETVYVRDTLIASRTLTRYDSVRVRDTVVVDRVVYVNRDTADAAVRACRAVMSSCAATVDSLHGVIRAKDAEIGARDADRPSRLHTILNNAAWLGVGYVAGRAGIGANISIHLPFP